MKRPLEGTLLADNALARQALENIAKIEQDAQRKKLEQLDNLKSAKAAILQRIAELNHQLAQVEQVMATVTGSAAAPRAPQARRSWQAERERVGRWMEGRKGQKFAARDLVREFPELDGRVMSLFLKPLIETGQVKTDTSRGCAAPDTMRQARPMRKARGADRSLLSVRVINGVRPGAGAKARRTCRTPMPPARIASVASDIFRPAFILAS